MKKFIVWLKSEGKVSDKELLIALLCNMAFIAVVTVILMSVVK